MIGQTVVVFTVWPNGSFWDIKRSSGCSKSTFHRFAYSGNLRKEPVPNHGLLADCNYSVVHYGRREKPYDSTESYRA